MAASKSKKKYLQVFLDSYTAEFLCFVTSRKGDKYGFCTTCTCDVSVSHGGKADIKPKSQQRPSFLGSYQIAKTAAASADVCDEVQRDPQKRKEPRSKMDATLAKKVKLSFESTGRASLTREERLLYFLTSDVNFAYGLFLKSVILVFDKANAQLQSQAPQIHLLQSLLMQFLRDLLARVIHFYLEHHTVRPALHEAPLVGACRTGAEVQ
ncbi:hypothetical protein HPB51_003062 [Rhipicephalus microplus]|uniref:Uncharacterized protein n=1 Tax=Rhipicephalus microplus TaxID=6941 RepID=A0A9J6D7Z6_RHIMP|nr:hypothetical protein HPB51_003062 [Rhipicephalus microplus]